MFVRGLVISHLALVLALGDEVVHNNIIRVRLHQTMCVSACWCLLILCVCVCVCVEIRCEGEQISCQPFIEYAKFTIVCVSVCLQLPSNQSFL